MHKYTFKATTAIADRNKKELFGEKNNSCHFVKVEWFPYKSL